VTTEGNHVYLYEFFMGVVDETSTG